MMAKPKPPTKSHLAKMANVVRLAFEDESRDHRILWVYRYVKNGRVHVEVYSEGGDRRSEGMVFVLKLLNDYLIYHKIRGEKKPTTTHYLEQIVTGLQANGVDV